jgi:hypothetical protein
VRGGKEIGVQKKKPHKKVQSARNRDWEQRKSDAEAAHDAALRAAASEQKLKFRAADDIELKARADKRAAEQALSAAENAIIAAKEMRAAAAAGQRVRQCQSKREAHVEADKASKQRMGVNETMRVNEAARREQSRRKQEQARREREQDWRMREEEARAARDSALDKAAKSMQRVLDETRGAREAAEERLRVAQEEIRQLDRKRDKAGRKRRQQVSDAEQAYEEIVRGLREERRRAERSDKFEEGGRDDREADSETWMPNGEVKARKSAWGVDDSLAEVNLKTGSCSMRLKARLEAYEQES